MVGRCPDSAELAAFAVGDLAESRLQFISEHLDQCATCLQLVAQAEPSSDPLVVHLARPLSAEVVAAEDSFQQLLPRLHAIPLQPSESLDTDVREGQLVREYRLLEKLGQGGMGTVYRAVQTKLDKVVALKVLPDDRLHDQEAVSRFEREMKAVGRLDHLHIVRAMDAGESEGIHYLVMEFLDGVDLSRLVKRLPPLPVRVAIELVRQATLGLAHAHAHDLIHRDVKPSNLLLDRTGTVKVLDLGLARSTVANQPLPEDAELTESGRVIGTVDYIAPEQALDTRIADARSDIYSIGCTLYYVLTGKPPYRGETILKRVVAHREGTIPSLREARSDVPVALDQLFQSLIARDPAERPQEMSAVTAALDAVQQSSPGPAGATCHELIEVLERARPRNKDAEQALIDTSQADLHGSTIPALRPAEPDRRRHRTFLFAGLVGLLALGVIIVSTMKSRLVIESHVDDVRVVITQDGAEVTVADLTTGSLVRYLPAGTYEVQVRDAASDVVIEPTIVHLKRWGKDVVTITQEAKATLTASGAEEPETPLVPRAPRVITNAIPLHNLRSEFESRCLQYSANGEYLAVGGMDGTIELRQAPGGRPLHQIPCEGSHVHSLAFSPDSRLCAAAMVDNRVILIEVETGQRLFEFKGHTAGVTGVLFSPSDKQLLFSCSTDESVRLWDLEKREVRAVWRPDVERIYDVAISSDGTLLAAAAGGGIVLWNTLTEELQTIVKDAAIMRCDRVAFSSNSTQLAVCDSYGTIYLFDVATRKLSEELAGHNSRLVALQWQGDYLFSASRDGFVYMWQPGTASRPLRPLTIAEEQTTISGIAVSADVEFVAVNVYRRGVQILRLVDQSRSN